jgi:formyl-CoA transferase
LRQPVPVPPFEGVDAADLRPAPLLGEHTVDVLLECGMEHDDVRALVEQGVVVHTTIDEVTRS